MKCLSKVLQIISVFAVLFCVSAYADNASPQGYWQTVNEDNHQPNSVVKVQVENGVLSGKIVKLYANPQAVCSACGGDLHNKPLLGMTVLSGFSQQNNGWSGGKVLAVRKGVVFDGSVSLINGGQQLQVSVKTPFGSRAQVWQRVSSAEVK